MVQNYKLWIDEKCKHFLNMQIYLLLSETGALQSFHNINLFKVPSEKKLQKIHKPKLS